MIPPDRALLADSLSEKIIGDALLGQKKIEYECNGIQDSDGN